MDQLSVLHTFENGSTFLADVPSSILLRPMAEEAAAASRAGSHHRGRPEDGDKYKGGQHAFMHADSSPVDSAQHRSKAGREEKELSVMRLVPINGSVDFHARFRERCDSYCRLCRRLQRAVEWLLLKRPCHDGRDGEGATVDSSATDVDSLSQVIVYPLEPTVFLAAAFALPSLVSVMSALPDGESAATNGATSSLSMDSPAPSHGVQVVPYCFFYSFPGQRLLFGRNAAGGRKGMTFAERFISVANATSVCGAAPPTKNSLCARSVTRSGLTLAAYLEARLPRSVHGANRQAESVHGIDFLSRWSDDILWRLLSALVSALAVVHAAGFHFCGELSAEDVLCFAIPSDCDAADAEQALFHGKRQHEKVVPSIGQRLESWTNASVPHWAITEMTPTHHAFFFLSTLPRSLFIDDPQDPSVVATLQRRDIVAAGRIILSVLEEVKRRREGGKANSCLELLFVAERMVAVETGSGGDTSANEAPAHRFAQLQVIRLRTHLWLLRKVIEERDAQLATAVMNHKVSANGENGNTNNFVDRSNGRYPHRLTSSSPLRTDDGADMAKLQERERLLAEREEKLNRFLLLYELTAERLDQLPVGKDGFDRLKQSLQQAPHAEATTNSAIAGISPPGQQQQQQQQSQSQSQSQSQHPRSTRNSVEAEASLRDHARQPFRHTRLSRGDDAVSVSPPTTTTATATTVATPLHSSTGAVVREGRQPDAAQQQMISHSTPVSTSRRAGVDSSSQTSLHPNWKTITQVLAREGVDVSMPSPRSPAVQQLRNHSPQSSKHGMNTRVDAALTSVPPFSSASRTRPSAVVPSTNTASSPSTARSSNAVITSRGYQMPHANSFSSTLPSPGFSPLTRVADDSSSPLVSVGGKTPPSPQSRNIRITNAPSRAGMMPLNTPPPPPPPPAASAHWYTSMSPNDTLNSRAAGDSQPIAMHLHSSTVKAKSARYDPSMYTGGAKERTPPPPPPAAAAAAAAAAAMANTATAAFRVSRTPPPSSSSVRSRCDTQRSEKSNNKRDNLQVVKMYDGNGHMVRDSTSETPHRNNYAAGGTKPRTPAGRSLGARHTVAAATPAAAPPPPPPPPAAAAGKSVPMDLSLNLSKVIGNNNRRLQSRSQPPSSNRLQRPQENDEGETPRTMRSRFAHDGWVDKHLAVLEQLRCDFHQFETAKSARNTPNGKVPSKAVRGHSSGEVESSTPGRIAATVRTCSREK